MLILFSFCEKCKKWWGLCIFKYDDFGLMSNGELEMLNELIRILILEKFKFLSKRFFLELNEI